MIGSLKGISKKIEKNKFAYLFILPSSFFIVGLELIPLIMGVAMSFFGYEYGLRPGQEVPFVGLKNYWKLFNDPVFWIAFKNTFIWSFTVVCCSMALALLIALILNQRFRGRYIIRSLALLPWVIPWPTAAVMFAMIYHNQFGLLKYFLVDVLGFTQFRDLNILGNPSTSLISVAFVQLWKITPYFAVVLLGAMQSIPQELFDAADVDGANFLQKFRYVIMPAISPVFLTLTLLNILWSFKAFTLIYNLTGGGPANSSQILGTYNWWLAFAYERIGSACALGVLMLIILATIALAYLKLFSNLFKAE